MHIVPCAKNPIFLVRKKSRYDTNFSLWVYLKMERSAPTLLVVFSIFSAIVLQCDLSLAQQCTVSCAQTAVIRNMPYEEILEVVQNREWENEDDFGEDLLDLIRRHRRIKRANIVKTSSMIIDYRQISFSKFHQKVN